MDQQEKILSDLADMKIRILHQENKILLLEYAMDPLSIEKVVELKGEVWAIRDTMTTHLAEHKVAIKYLRINVFILLITQLLFSIALLFR